MLHHPGFGTASGAHWRGVAAASPPDGGAPPRWHASCRLTPRRAVANTSLPSPSRLRWTPTTPSPGFRHSVPERPELMNRRRSPPAPSNTTIAIPIHLPHEFPLGRSFRFDVGREAWTFPRAPRFSRANIPRATHRRPLFGHLRRPARRAPGRGHPAHRAEGRRPIAVHSDAKAYKPLNWMSPPCTIRVTDTTITAETPKGERLVVELHEVLHDTRSSSARTPASRRTASRPSSRHSSRCGSPRSATTSRSCGASTRPTSARSTSSAATATGARSRSR